MLAPPPGENMGFIWATAMVFDLFPKISYCYHLFENIGAVYFLKVMGEISCQAGHLFIYLFF